ncbi:MAG: hypothetical protein KK476_20520 [Sinorhizobium fredii]|nr:hypothetical protein [Sinorhizobium fredii]
MKSGLAVTACAAFAFLSGCQSKDRTSYDLALDCMETANVLKAAAGATHSSLTTYDQAERFWYARAVSEGAKVGEPEPAVRSTISDRLGKAVAMLRDEAGKPDMRKIKSHVTDHEKRFQTCSTKI